MSEPLYTDEDLTTGTVEVHALGWNDGFPGYPRIVMAVLDACLPAIVERHVEQAREGWGRELTGDPLGRKSEPWWAKEMSREDMAARISVLSHMKTNAELKHRQLVKLRKLDKAERDALAARLAAAERVIEWVPRYALLDVWMALGGDSQAFERWMDEPRRTIADGWAQVLAWVRREPPSSDTNPPSGPHPREAL